MSKDTILKDENGVLYSYDNIRTQGWLEGHGSGLEQAANFLLERSKSLFVLKKDTDAIWLRSLSEELKELAKAAKVRAEQHEKENPDVVLFP